MLMDANNLATLTKRPWQWIPAGACIFLAVLSLSLIHICAGGANGSQSVRTDEAADDDRIGHVVKLLENIAD